MSRSRMWWHKVSHDRVLRDPYVSALPYDALGLLTHLECLVGSTVRGHETGILHSEDGARITVDELLFLLGRGEDAREASIRKSLELLIRARQIKCNKADLAGDGSLKLLHWATDQGLARSGDVDRKRAAAEDARRVEADQVAAHLERWFKRLGRAVSDEELLIFIKARRGGRPQQRTCEAILEIWFEQGVLLRDADGLCTLASLVSGPPLGVGAVGSVGDGAGGEIFPVGKIPVEKELDPANRMLTHSQLDPVGRTPASTRSNGRGGGPETSEARVQVERGKTNSGSLPDSKVGADRLDVAAAPNCLADCLYEPADAWRVEDPVHAAGQLLSQLPGWNAVHQPKDNRPKSEYVLLARWKDMRRTHGPKVANEIWRKVLSHSITDRTEGHAWRTWTGVFLKRLCDLSDAYAVDVAGDEVGS